MEFDMKKKLIVATAIVLLLAMSVTMLAGCDEIFKKNDQRDAQQVVASVSYDSALFGKLTDTVYKFELESNFNSYAYYYVNYYGMTYEAAANYIAQSLAQQKLLVLFAKAKVAELEEKTSLPDGIDGLLSSSEKNKAIEDTNESLLDSLVSTVKNLVTEDNANASTSDKKKDTTTEITDPVYVKFDSNGGSSVEKIKVQKGDFAEAPDDPTKDGYTFYGWFEKDSDKEFDFENTAISATITLYAKWVEYLAPRTQLPEKEEEDDYDADLDVPDAKLADKFFSDEYKAQLLDDKKEDSLFTTKFLESDFVDNIIVDDGETLVGVLKDYINEGLAEMETNLKNNLYKKTVEECYDYYLNAQHQSLIVARLKRMVAADVSVTEEEIEAEFNAQVAKNKETFAGSDSSYESALTSTLNKTYYHPAADQGYGFVINILFKLDDKGMEELNEMATNNPENAEAILLKRNRLLAEMTANVANPKYDSTAIVEDSEGKKIELRDPMTDAKNPYNNVGEQDKSYQVEGGNNYNKILSFEKNEKTGKFEIKFNATEHPAMAYLSEKVAVFDKDGQVGLIHQIYDSLKQVKDAVKEGELTREEGVYWLREVATTWAYLVSDDTGATSSSSNNNGLGYLVSPEGKDSSFLADFTDYARKLIVAGTGSFANGTITPDMFKGNLTDGQFAGNNKVFVVADSLVSDGKATANSNAYAGVFVLLNSYTVWDDANIKSGSATATLPTDGKLPMDYVMTFAKDADDVQTLHDVIKDTILEAKKNDLYNAEVNDMFEAAKDGITYYDKVIKQLYKDLA